jgi:hypothetical protein
MKLTKIRLKCVLLTLFSLVILADHSMAISGSGRGGPGKHNDNGLDPRFDTSFAMEYSDSCLGGGCHETDIQLMEEHADSFMTHAMVKCNACHGTHTADSVGVEKPNLTGYYPGIGASGYQVGDDRCIACHTPTLDRYDHPYRTWDCISCHTPHRFSVKRRLGKN